LKTTALLENNTGGSGNLSKERSHKHQPALLGAISFARTKFHYSCVAASAILVPWPDLGEQLIDNYFVLEPTKDNPPCVEVPTSRQRDDLLGITLASLGALKRCVDFAA